MGKHKASYMLKAYELETKEVETYDPAPGELRIKVAHVGVCGSDLHFFQDGKLGNWVVEQPLILGHETAGYVDAIGEGVTGFKIGDKVALEPGEGCGECYYCKTGRYNICDGMSFFACPGQRPGTFQEYVNHPASLCFKLPDNVSTMEGALIEPFAVGLHAVKLAKVSLGQSAVILGSGCIGLVTLMALKASGACPIIVVDIVDKRLEKAKELGANYVINANKEDVEAKVLEYTDGENADFVFEMAGVEKTVQQTVRLVRKGGTVILVGLTVNPEVNYDLGTLMVKEAHIETIFRYRNLYPPAIKLLQWMDIPLKEIVSDIFTYDDLENGLVKSIQDKENIIKSVISFE